jgi:MATE family multidrug resistance protein
MSFSFFILVPTLPLYLKDTFGISQTLVGVVLSCYVIAVLSVRPIAGFVAFTWDGIYIGATASKTIRNSMIWSVAAFYLVFFVGVKTFEGPDAAIHVLLAAYFAHLLARSIHLTVKNKRIVFTDPFVSDKE